MKEKNTVKKLTLRAMLVALAFVLSWVEAQIPYFFAIPGIKLGLGNLVVLVALYKLGNLDAFLINIVRILLTSITFSSMSAFPYALAGGILSFIVMYILKRYTKSSIKMVSVAGGISHNVGQIVVAMLVLENTKIVMYLPYLWISGIIAGIAIGLICEFTEKRIPVNVSIYLCLLVSFTMISSGCGRAIVKESRQAFAMDTYMTVDVWGENAGSVADKAIDEINRIDHLWSVGFSDSEISVLNESGSKAVSTDTTDIVNRVIELSNQTNGALDITVYPIMDLWGFTSKNYKVPDDSEINSALSHVGMSNIAISGNKLTLLNGAKIDFGAVAKGYATDKIKDILINAGIESAMINLGGNIYALGYKTDKKSEWNLAIENPNKEIFNKADYIGILKLHDKALVTSGDYNRFFVENNKKYHHIMDPTTGYPADNGLISVSIISSDATLADALSTALFVMGKDNAVKFWNEKPETFDMVLVEKNGSITITEGIKSLFTSDYDYQIVAVTK